MPSPEMNAILEFLQERKASRATRPPTPLDEARKNYAPCGQLRPLPEEVAVTPVNAQGVPAFWLDAPNTAASSRVLFFVHGGGYSRGSLRSHGPLAAHLGATLARRVFFPEYRLAPEFPFPAAFDDTLAAWRWLTSVGVAPSSIVVAGDSAGGALSLALMHALRDAGETLPAAAVLISPYLDLTGPDPSIAERVNDPSFTPAYLHEVAAMYLNGADPRNPLASPLFADHSGLPPLLLQVGSAEFLRCDSERLAAAAAQAGVEVTLDMAEGLPHVYQVALHTSETARAIHQIAEFANRF
ncbi:alpha/beta hydrolase [Acidobacteria bacterium AB60]|nr:alpha/beta hydrolase [Acidobacteria bacterium AB60]